MKLTLNYNNKITFEFLLNLSYMDLKYIYIYLEAFNHLSSLANVF